LHFRQPQVSLHIGAKKRVKREGKKKKEKEKEKKTEKKRHHSKWRLPKPYGNLFSPLTALSTPRTLLPTPSFRMLHEFDLNAPPRQFRNHTMIQISTGQAKLKCVSPQKKGSKTTKRKEKKKKGKKKTETPSYRDSFSFSPFDTFNKPRSPR
jgi:hypothetical protein